MIGNNTPIMLAEVDIQVLHGFNEKLKNLKAQIITSTNGQQALDIMNATPIDILVLDLKMPKVNGLEVLKKINELEEINTDVVVISGERKLLNKLNLEYYRFINCVLLKPIDIKTVYKDILYIIENRKTKNKIKVIEKILNEFDFNKSSKGYTYLMEAVIRIIDNPEDLTDIENNIYKMLANKYNLENINKIKWCIIKTINAMNRFTENEKLEKYFPKHRKITPKCFMRVAYEKYREEIERL